MNLSAWRYVVGYFDDIIITTFIVLIVLLLICLIILIQFSFIVWDMQLYCKQLSLQSPDFYAELYELRWGVMCWAKTLRPFFIQLTILLHLYLSSKP